MTAEPTPPPPETPSAETIRVGIKDSPASTVRNTADLVGIIAHVVGIALICLLVIYAHNTTEGMAADVRAFAGLLQRILFVPVTVLDAAVILVPPLAVGIDLLVRRYAMTLLQGLVGAVGGIIINVTLVFLLKEIGPQSLVTGLSIGKQGTLIVTIPAYVSAITALLTAVASPARRKSVTWSWNLMWVAVVVSVITTSASLPGMAIALLVGRACGYGARYAVGIPSQRAYGLALLDGIRRAGFAPLTIDRVAQAGVPETQMTNPGVQTPQFFADHRLYAMKTLTGKEYNVIVLDGDRQMMGTIVRVWTYLRSRGVEGRNIVSLRQTAERSALLSYAVRSAGVSTPAVLAIAEAEDSMLIVREATRPSISFANIPDTDITDDLIDAMWAELGKAHHCSIAHGNLTPDAFRIGVGPEEGSLWVVGWEGGDVASSELALRLDRTQMVSLLAARVGPMRALDSANRVLSSDEVAALGPLLQIPAVPKATRVHMEKPKEVLAELRAELAKVMPEAQIQPEKITRLSARTVFMVVLVAVAIIAVLATFNLSEVVEAVGKSDWRWAVAAFVVGMVGFVGASLTFTAFSPVKLSLWRTYVCQLAASFVAVAAPAGLGPAAVNLRVLNKRGVPTPLAAATVALTQVATGVVTIVVLVIVTVITGSTQLTSFEVTPAMLVVIGIVAAAVGAVFIYPRTRRWAIARVTPMLEQTWPRLVELLSNPWRLALGLGGIVILIASYVTAMYWSMLAFGQDQSYLAAGVVYLLGNSAGAFLPTPGGVGAIEVTESGALVAIGLNAGVAASIVLLFRLVTYWIRIPLGWVAYRYAHHIGEL
ncbi:MAG: flippase-like domain-containing protein [Propionibacteriaceae bacterium]|jgi:uncharacterized protein (TIRG00374 family)|nr:flippase-like domain-containing protein [Propionibacteriaceae bacterium]